MEDADRLRDRLLAEVAEATDLDGLERARVAALGKKGVLTQHMKGLRELAPDARKAAGAALNAVKDAVVAAIEARKTAPTSAAMRGWPARASTSR